MSQVSVREDVEEFVLARSDRLLRTAYLLTGDRDRAEALLQEALAEAWDDWDHGELDPDTAVLSGLVRLHAWPRRATGSRSPEGDATRRSEVHRALGRLPARERAVLVLRHATRLGEADTATLLGCSTATVHRLEARAVHALGSADPRAALAELAAAVPPGNVSTRLREVETRSRARRRRGRRRVAAGLLVAVVVSVVAVRTWPTAPPPVRGIQQEELVEAPPTLLGRELPPVLRRHHRDFVFHRSESSAPGAAALTVTLVPSEGEQLLLWAGTVPPGGRVVLRVDGAVAGAGTTGRLEPGVVLEAGRAHVVSLSSSSRTTRPATRLGIAVYR